MPTGPSWSLTTPNNHAQIGAARPHRADSLTLLSVAKNFRAFAGNRIGVRFENELHGDRGQWYRGRGNENWKFEANGLMQRRFASINDPFITQANRKLRWDRSTPSD